MKKTFEEIKKKYDTFKTNPREGLLKLKDSFITYLKNNKLFVLFVFLNVFNAALLRYLTINRINNLLDISPILGDLSFVLLIGSASYLLREKYKFNYLFVITFILSLICLINSSYYTNYTSFSSISQLSTTKFIVAVGDAVVENILKFKDFVYLFAPAILYFFHRQYSKNGHYKESGFLNVSKKLAKATLITTIVTTSVFLLQLRDTDYGTLVRQWNRENIVMRFGIYTYHLNDAVKSLEPKLVSLFGFDDALKSFNEYFEGTTKEKNNTYTGVYEGKNIISIHGESLQSFLIGLKFNGQEVTPNLNKLVAGGLYFDNFYAQVNVGNSSDTEFTFNTSLMPANVGTAFGNYADKEYISIPKLLKEKGYYNFSMHGNNVDYWNRRVMHKNLGYDHLFGKTEYDIDEEIGLGLSDVSFFKQSVLKLEEIAKEHDKYYGTLIMLSNHTPFNQVDKYGEFPVDIKELAYNEETGKTEEVIYPYMEGTKFGNYIKSAHYADYALGVLLEELEAKGLLDNTVIVLYGDHDAKLPIDDYVRLYNYDKENDSILDEDDPEYVPFEDYDYELMRKVPLIIWSKDSKVKPEVISYPMGMYNVMPTLGNMFGFYNGYALGKDIFNVKENNIVPFPNGSWLSKDMYYNSREKETYVFSNAIVNQEEVIKNTDDVDKLLKVSNDILIYDLIRNSKLAVVNEEDIIKKGS